ncbi:hypothetical protein N399_24605 (plasmid) [Bacillus licheniformis CG-B52]|jgi:hypothetical protein|uniref:hypothetical protein n=1 Tax=Bacillus TaxID=1386 RepID=UPI00038E64BC|nr:MULTISPECIES: hypothetical protein [Bacillus]EQM25424.1 hypothetical protein N399_24605 [Bacillus licheniformis CG-B52]MED4547620.1 hypothetical protein [Bacillus licheniformis]
MTKYYKVDKNSDLHSDLEYVFYIKGNFLKEMNEEISQAIGIEDAYNKVAYSRSSEPVLFIESKFKNEVEENDLKKHPVCTGDKAYYEFKKRSKPNKAFLKFVENHNLNKVITRQNLTMVVRFFHNFRGRIEINYYNEEFWIESHEEQHLDYLHETTEADYYEMRLNLAKKKETV